MWKYMITSYYWSSYGEYINDVENENGDIPTCTDKSDAIAFNSVEELFSWVKENTSLDIENNSFRIVGEFFYV